jgi:hypothetical protein
VVRAGPELPARAGPRTALAKKRIRRNALRHGLAAAIVNAPGMPAEINHLAQAICGSDAGPAQREQAQIIAECELLLLRVRAARVKIFEEISRSESRAKGVRMVVNPLVGVVVISDDYYLKL